MEKAITMTTANYLKQLKLENINDIATEAASLLASAQMILVPSLDLIKDLNTMYENYKKSLSRTTIVDVFSPLEFTSRKVWKFFRPCLEKEVEDLWCSEPSNCKFLREIGVIPPLGISKQSYVQKVRIY